MGASTGPQTPPGSETARRSRAVPRVTWTDSQLISRGAARCPSRVDQMAPDHLAGELRDDRPELFSRLGSREGGIADRAVGRVGSQVEGRIEHRAAEVDR